MVKKRVPTTCDIVTFQNLLANSVVLNMGKISETAMN